MEGNFVSGAGQDSRHDGPLQGDILRSRISGEGGERRVGKLSLPDRAEEKKKNWNSNTAARGGQIERRHNSAVVAGGKLLGGGGKLYFR